MYRKKYVNMDITLFILRYTSKIGRTPHLPTSMSFFANVGFLQCPNATLKAEPMHEASSISNALEIFLSYIYKRNIRTPESEK